MIPDLKGDELLARIRDGDPDVAVVTMTVLRIEAMKPWARRGASLAGGAACTEILPVYSRLLA